MRMEGLKEGKTEGSSKRMHEGRKEQKKEGVKEEKVSTAFRILKFCETGSTEVNRRIRRHFADGRFAKLRLTGTDGKRKLPHFRRLAQLGSPCGTGRNRKDDILQNWCYKKEGET